METMKPIDVLMIEDSPSDAELTLEALRDAKVHITMHVVDDGVKGMAYLRREGEYAQAPRPDVILLDLNLPRKDGRQVLKEIREDKHLNLIPVVILTTSEDDRDIIKSYELRANAYVVKPVDFDQFVKVVRTIDEFWFEIVRLPSQPPQSERP